MVLICKYDKLGLPILFWTLLPSSSFYEINEIRSSALRESIEKKLRVPRQASMFFATRIQRPNAPVLLQLTKQISVGGGKGHVHQKFF